MENGSTLGTWLAYTAIVLFLRFLLALVLRPMALFSTLTFMPISRVTRWFLGLFGHGGA